MVLVVADAGGDELDPPRVDQRDPGGSVDELPVGHEQPDVVDDERAHRPDNPVTARTAS